MSQIDSTGRRGEAPRRNSGDRGESGGVQAQQATPALAALGVSHAVYTALGHWAIVYGDFAVTSGTKRGGAPSSRVLKKGETFILVATMCRIQEITLDCFIFILSPGEPGKMPFWRGEGPGRLAGGPQRR